MKNLFTRQLFSIAICLIVPIVIDANDGLSMVDSITKDGVTWRFSNPVSCGQFVTGDYYVIGKVTVVSITPAPQNNRNGSVVNPTFKQISGYDDRVDGNRFREELRKYSPIELNPGDMLLSSISVSENEHRKLERWLREGQSDRATSPVYSISILTCLEKPVPADAFRPSYCDSSRKIYYYGDINYELLPKLEKVKNTPDIAIFAEHFRRPWVDICQFLFDAPVAYMPDYGREIARAVGMASLLLILDYPKETKEQLMIGLVQYGIDLWGMVRNGHIGWPAHGGHGSGRKWPIIFSGILLGDKEMAQPTVTFPNVKFGEDMHTAYDSCWTGAKVVYAGHQGIWDGKPVSSKPSWGPYEHLHPTLWESTFESADWYIGESYRRCCTSIAWVSEALAARLMGAKELWNHDAFFDYVDRWMTEDDSEHVKVLDNAGKTANLTFSANFQRQGQSWDPFVNQMWEKYRSYVNDSKIRKHLPKQLIRPAKIKKKALIMIDNKISISDELMKQMQNRTNVMVYSISGKKLGTYSAGTFSRLNNTKGNLVNGVYFCMEK